MQQLSKTVYVYSDDDSYSSSCATSTEGCTSTSTRTSVGEENKSSASSVGTTSITSSIDLSGTSVETRSISGIGSPVGSGSSTDNVLETAVASSVDAVVKVDAITVAASAADEPAVMRPFSMVSTTFSATWLLEDDGMKRVHQKTSRMLRSTKRCFRMKSTTRMKNIRAAIISMRSSQSDFSSAVTRCFEVTSRLSRTSWVDDVNFNEAVDWSKRVKIQLRGLKEKQLETCLAAG